MRCQRCWSNSLVSLLILTSMLLCVAFRRSLRPKWTHTINSKRLCTAGDLVTLSDGRSATVVEKNRGGWFSLKVLGETEEVVKLRKGDFKLSSLSESPVDSSRLELITDIANDKPTVFPPILRIEPPFAHQAMKKWVIFSDLHVKTASLETCEMVLDAVHEAAVKRGAGIMFLGDFWHVRGSLNVDLLNRVLKCLGKWQQPVIMIPGNHDQVTLGGAVHALEPLKYAFSEDKILMIDDPAVCLNALWIPYRRSKDHMRAVLNSIDPGEVSAVFCHADVRGAWMNDNIQSREGLDIQLFPAGMPIFSGHFHKPHSIVLRDKQLRYVGSPYQTSLSEADQVKYLYEVSLEEGESGRAKWKETERWPFVAGKRYFRIDNPQSDRLQEVRPGDTVVLQNELHNRVEVDALARRLQDQGVEAIVRDDKLSEWYSKSSLVLNDGDEAMRAQSDGEVVSGDVNFNGAMQDDDLFQAHPVIHPAVDPSLLFQQYINNLTSAQLSPLGKNDGDATAMEAVHQMRARILAEGQQLIATHRHSEEKDTSPLAVAGTTATGPWHLCMESLYIRNFGPYGSTPVQYPLSQRGLVLIRGQTLDGSGADSNGSGKTTLAMSLLWCLTGGMDTRLSQDMRSWDVTFDGLTTKSTAAEDSKRQAEVRITGTINGKTFEVRRRKTTKKQELFFSVDGQDLTTQAVKDTQAVIDATLGLHDDVLQRCYFFGQHSHTAQSLLGLSDARMKEELGLLLDLDIWNSIVTDCRSKEKQQRLELQEMDMKQRFHRGEVARLNGQKNELDLLVQRADKELQMLCSERDTLLRQRQDEQGNSASGGQSKLSDLESKIRVQEAIRKEIQQSRVEVLRKRIYEAVQTMSDDRTACKQQQQHQQVSVSGSIDPLAQLHVEEGRVRALVSSTNASVVKYDNRLNKTLPAELLQLEQSIQDTVTSMHEEVGVDSDPKAITFTTEGLTPEGLGVFFEHHRQRLEDVTGVLGGLSEQIRTVNSSMIKLQHHNVSDEQHDDNNSSRPHNHTSLAAGEQCPTCGQTVLVSDLTARRQELETQLRALLQERLQRLRLKDQLGNLTRYGRSLDALFSARQQLHQEVEGLQEERNSLVNEHRQLLEELAGVEGRLQSAQASLQAQQQEKQLTLHRLQDDLEIAEADLRDADHRLDGLKQSHEDAMREHSQIASQETTVNTAITVQEGKHQSIVQRRDEKAGELRLVEENITALEVQRQKLLYDLLVSGFMIDFCGTRGIQHYLFHTLLAELEAVANSYLRRLSEGGLVLQLRSDESGERILKSVLVQQAVDDATSRRERALVQLSGGQWRRVSLALDLAFTECVQRRGRLTSNVLVLDEILTHLDSQGREAVGALLKALVQQSQVLRHRAATSASAADASASTTRVQGFDTVLVILQDLAAAELEEAFDHIDVVRKEGGVSKVLIDAGFDGSNNM